MNKYIHYVMDKLRDTSTITWICNNIEVCYSYNGRSKPRDERGTFSKLGGWGYIRPFEIV